MTLLDLLTAEAKLKAMEKRVRDINVYRIVDRRMNATIFVGSSSQTESLKMAYHRSAARAGNQQPVHAFMQQNGVENYMILPLETFKYSDPANASIREQYWIEHFDPICNKIVKPKVLKPLTCYCGIIIQGEAAMKRHLNLPKHKKITDKEPMLDIRNLFK